MSLADDIRADLDRISKATRHYPAGAPGGKGGQFAPGDGAKGGGAPDLSGWSKPVSPDAVLQDKATAQLQSESPSSWKAKYHLADLTGAVRSAARFAQKNGTTAFVFPAQGWRVEYAGSASLSGTRSIAYLGREKTPLFLSVSPKGEVYRHTWADQVKKAGGGKPPQHFARWPAGSPGSKGGEFAPGGTTGTASRMASLLAPFLGLPGTDTPLGRLSAPTAQHPRVDDQGHPVVINHPTKASTRATWANPDAIATFTPGGDAPDSLGGVAFRSWKPPADGWAKVAGQNASLIEPPMTLPPGKYAAAGVIVQEKDGRVWIVEPTNRFGGYDHTFPKGSAEKGLSLQANAIKEAWEETGLKVQITGHFGDFERDTSVGRYYLARRTSGTPKDAGWESQSVRLVPPGKLKTLLNRTVDKEIADGITAGGKVSKAIEDLVHAFVERFEKAGRGSFNPSQPRWPAGTPLGGQWMASGATGFTAPPKIGSASNDSYLTKANALFDAAGKGWKGEIKAVVDKLGEKVEAAKAKPAQNSHDKWTAQLHQYGTHLLGQMETHAAVVTQASTINGVTNLHDLTHTGPKPGGSAAGGMYVDKAGQKWMVKGYGNDDQARSEVLASKLMAAAGIPAPEMKLVALGVEHKGGLGVMSKWIDDAVPFATASATQMGDLQKQFAVHAWLANWDVVGLAKDNVMWTPEGVMNIDPGGALDYRAMGTKKGAAFGATVGEIKSMRDAAVNSQAASVFGSMTASQIASSSGLLANMGAAEIHALVKAYGPGSADDKHALAEKLIARRSDIIGQVANMMDAPKPSTTPPPLAPVSPPPAPVIAAQPMAAGAHIAGTGGGPTMGKPSFVPAPGANSFQVKAAKFYNTMAAKAEALHAISSLAGLKALATKHDGKPAWPDKTPNGKVMSVYHAALVKDLESKAAAAPVTTMAAAAPRPFKGAMVTALKDANTPDEIIAAGHAHATSATTASASKIVFLQALANSGKNGYGLTAQHAAQAQAVLDTMGDNINHGKAAAYVAQIKANAKAQSPAPSHVKSPAITAGLATAKTPGELYELSNKLHIPMSSTSDADKVSYLNHLKDALKTHGEAPGFAGTAVPHSDYVAGTVKDPIFATTAKLHAESIKSIVEGKVRPASNVTVAGTMNPGTGEFNAASKAMHQDQKVGPIKYQSSNPDAAVSASVAQVVGGGEHTGKFKSVLLDDDSGMTVGITWHPTLAGAMDDANKFTSHPALAKPAAAAPAAQATPAAAAPSAPKPAMPDFEAAKLTQGVNAPSHNAKVATIKALADVGSPSAILSLGFGTNTYGKQQVTLANDVLAALGSAEKVVVGQKKNSHPSLTGQVQAKQVAEATAALAEAKAVGGKGTFDPAKLPEVPNFHNWKGTGKGLSSKPHVNDANKAEAEHIYALAYKADEHGFKNYSLKSPSGTLSQYHNLLGNALEDMLHPPPPLGALPESHGGLSEAAAIFASYHLVGTSLKSIKQHPTTQFYVALGVAKDIPKFSEASAAPSENWVADHKASYQKYSSLSKEAISTQQGSAEPFRNKKLTDKVSQGHSGNFGQVVAAWRKDASPLQVGTKMYRYLRIADHDMEKMLSMPAGTVLADLTTMAFSHKNGLNANFGGYDNPSKIELITMPGSVGMASLGSPKKHYETSEAETTAVPGQRFVVAKIRKRAKGGIKIKGYWLPLDK